MAICTIQRTRLTGLRAKVPAIPRTGRGRDKHQGRGSGISSDGTTSTQVAKPKACRPRLRAAFPAADESPPGSGHRESGPAADRWRTSKSALSRAAAAGILIVVPLCYRRVTAVRKKRSISIPPELDAEIAAAAHDAGMSYSAWVAQTARKEFIIRAGLEAVSQYEDEHGPFTPDEIAAADEWAARVTRPSAARRTA